MNPFLIAGRVALLRRSWLVFGVLATLGFPQWACTGQTDISFFVLVKSSNYSQDVAGELTLLNYHFFSEIFLQPDGGISHGILTRHDNPDDPMVYEERENAYYIEGGHFDTLEDVDAAYPNGMFAFDIATPDGRERHAELLLSGPGGRTDIPAPITISFEQDGSVVSPILVDPATDLVVRWSEYSNGMADPRGIVDDMIFVVVADCHGERVFHTGLPFQGDYTTFRTTEITVRAGTLDGGQPYSAFVEFPHVVDSRVVDGVPGFTSYATATYIDIRTLGEQSDQSCPDAPPPMDTGQTDRMVEVSDSSR